MTVRSVETQDKMDMYVAHHLHDNTLTDIGTEQGVSRKTVRRCIDEVQTFLEGLNTGDTVVTTTQRGIVVAVELPIEDSMPIKLKLEDDETEWVDLRSVTMEVVEDQVEEEVADEGEDTVFVTINRNSLFSFAETMCYDEPVKAKVVNGGSYDIDGSELVRVGGEYFFPGTDYHFSKDEVTVVGEQGDEKENAQYFVTAPQDSITIVRIDQDTGDVSQRQTNKHRENFFELRDRIKADQSQEVLREIYEELDTQHMLKAYSVGRVKVDPSQESVVFVKPDGTERAVPDDVADDIVTTVRRHGRNESDKLVKFLDKLMDNVSFKAIEGLYRFMKHNCIEINDDGSIQAWKGVRDDLYSSHAGSLKSSPTITVNENGNVYNGDFGKEIRVDRSEVDDNPDQTCSHGLHVGNKAYASNWASTLIAVRVEPQDVVAVPKDYNGAKMRTCAYTPLHIAN